MGEVYSSRKPLKPGKQQVGRKAQYQPLILMYIYSITLESLDFCPNCDRLSKIEIFTAKTHSPRLELALIAFMHYKANQ